MDSLSWISNGLGELLYANECTTKVDCISFDRVLIEMDVARVLPKKLKVGYKCHMKERDKPLAPTRKVSK
ncbi:hypothetical protein RDI58_017953 [Solanum bulbocastanum]|uniref:Uncharacterized protein n=1 Tax=Solanum bulbocastanum TaxID=147425 RepID=A0AAN8YCI1_SOLBU